MLAAVDGRMNLISYLEFTNGPTHGRLLIDYQGLRDPRCYHKFITVAGSYMSFRYAKTYVFHS